MNVLFITADQWRGDSLASIGHPCVRTPNLDKLAAEGVLFRHHFSHSTPCAPGRASLYTGRYLMNHRVVTNGVPLDRRHKTVATEARSVGYDPVLFGYTDTAADPRGLPIGDPALKRVDNVMPGMTPMIRMGEDLAPWISYLEAKGYDIPDGEHGVFKTSPEICRANGRGRTFAPALYNPEHSATAFLTDEVINHIDGQADRPWFVHLSVLAPHPPFVVSSPYHDMYDPAAMPAPTRADTALEEGRQHPYLSYWLKHQRGTGVFVGHESADNLDLSDNDVAQCRATYFGMMTEVDHHLGRLLDHLRATGADQDTLVVFTSDHGEQLGDHWQFAKYGYFDETFHVPLIIREPLSVNRPTRGREITHFTESVDVMPTILEQLGAVVPPTCDGRALTPFLRGTLPPEWRNEVHCEFDFRNYGETPDVPPLGLSREECVVSIVRGERYKYVHFAALPALLFDLHTDPHEFTDVSDDPAYREHLLDCLQRTMNWRMKSAEQEMTNLELTPQGLVNHQHTVTGLA